MEPDDRALGSRVTHDHANGAAFAGQADAADPVNWSLLRRAAVAASRRAYVPYSRFPVGVAALTTTGRVITGCNVENAAYGVVLCAECGLVSTLINSAGAPEPGVLSDATPGDDVSSEARATDARPHAVLDLATSRELLVALSCVDGSGTPITPCGRCRQLLHEHALSPDAQQPGLLIEMADGEPLPLTELLPHAFGAPNLGAVASSAETLKGAS